MSDDTISQATQNEMEEMQQPAAKSTAMRFLYYLLPLLLLAGFIGLMSSGEYLKMPQGAHDNVSGSLQATANDIQAGRWNDAQSHLNDVENAWNQVIQREQYIVGRDEIVRLSSSVSRLRGAVAAEDKGVALTEMAEANRHWDDLGR